VAESSVLQDAPLIVIEVDPRLSVLAWNRQAELVFGTGASEAVGRPLAEVLPLADAAASWGGLLEAGEPGPRRWTVQRGETRQTLEGWTQVVRDGEGKPQRALLYAYDATARLAAEARAALESTMLTAIKDNIEIALWAVDKDGTFLYQDGKGARGAGLEPQQLVGSNIFEVFKDLGNGPLIAAAIAGEPQRTLAVETYGLYWDTHYIPVQDDPNGARVVGVTLDVTEAKRGELALRDKLELIERQQAVIRELATPIIEVWDGVLTMPIVGLIDTARTAEIMDNLLQAVTQTRARFAILDLTGVEVVDTGTAGHLIKLIQAIRLLGAEGILTGIHPSIAQTIVALGVDLSHVAVYAKLRDALKHCLLAMRKA
jgi:rsbT co-antagonist protein RsbR